jgi:hypothetical protein
VTAVVVVLVAVVGVLVVVVVVVVAAAADGVAVLLPLFVEEPLCCGVAKDGRLDAGLLVGVVV